MVVILTDFSLRIIRDYGGRVILITSSSSSSMVASTKNSKLKVCQCHRYIIILMTPLVTFFLADGRQTSLFLMNHPWKTFKARFFFWQEGIEMKEVFEGWRDPNGLRMREAVICHLQKISNQVCLWFSLVNDVFTFMSSGIFSAIRVGRASISDEHTREINSKQDFFWQ